MKWHHLGVFALLLLAGNWLCADDKKPPAAGHDRLEALASKLGLSSEQKEKLKKIHDDFDKKEDPLEAQVRHLRHEEHEAAHKILTEEQRKKLPALMKAEMESELHDIAGKLSLTSKQREHIHKIRADFDAKIEKLGKEGEKAAAQVRELRHKEFEAIRHELTDAQREKVPGLFREEVREWRDPAQRRKHMKALQEKLGLSEEQKKEMDQLHAKYDPQLDKLHTELQELHKQEHEAMNKVFTEEQRKKLQELRQGSGSKEKPKD